MTMEKHPKHVSPLMDQLPKNGGEAIRTEALSRLVSHFYSQKVAPEEATMRLYRTLTVYF